VERIVALAPGERITVFAPIVRGRKGEFREELEALDQQGFRARIDGEMVELTEGMRLEKRKNHTIEAIVDRIILKPLPIDPQDPALVNKILAEPLDALTVNGQRSTVNVTPSSQV
jgi:excinuclease ABC subunit A